jgi:hypothetical protein
MPVCIFYVLLDRGSMDYKVMDITMSSLQDLQDSKLLAVPRHKTTFPKRRREDFWEEVRTHPLYPLPFDSFSLTIRLFGPRPDGHFPVCHSIAQFFSRERMDHLLRSPGELLKDNEEDTAGPQDRNSG